MLFPTNSAYGSIPFKAKTRTLGPDTRGPEYPSRASHSILRSFPNLIEDLCGQRGFVLRKEATVVLLNYIGCILNCVARLLVGSGLLQNMRRENIPQVMGAMRQQAFDGTPPGVRVVNSIALDDRPPSFVERGRVVSCIGAVGLHRF